MAEKLRVIWLVHVQIISREWLYVYNFPRDDVYKTDSTHKEHSDKKQTTVV